MTISEGKPQIMKLQLHRFGRLRNLLLSFACLLVVFPGIGFAQDSFVVSDMRVVGLQRISEGTVFNYLPINIGDTVDQVRIQESIRALYNQALFDDIEIRRDGETLVIVVKERPSIESFTIDGNKDIKTEDLMDSLRNVGLARGKTFDRSVLDNVQQFLTEQYYDRGKYAVEVKADVTDRPNNTVGIKIDVKEGDRAKIRQVNIIGNVGRPGQIIMHDRTSFLEAVSLAGGVGEWANTKKIYIIREINGKRKKISVDYKNILLGNEEDIWILPGDIIVVP